MSKNLKINKLFLDDINGNIINQTFAQTNKIQQGNNDFTYTLLGEQSKIESTNGNLIFQAKNNIDNIGGSFEASKTLSLNSEKGDVNFKTLSLENGHNVYFKGGFDKALDIEHLGATASGGKNVIMKSGNNINLENAKIDATNQINLNAQNDVNIIAVNDVHYKDVQTSSKGFMSKNTQRDMSYKEEVQSTELNANDIVINGGNDVNLEASKLYAQNNLLVNAKNGDLNILAKEYKEGEIHHTSKSSFGGLKKSLDIKSSDSLKLNSALLETQAANVVITSGKDINILASEISSAADIQLKALNDVLIASQEEYLKTKEVHEKSSFNIAGLAGLVVPVGGNIYTQEIHKNDKVSSINKQSSLIAKENIIVDSGSTTIIGSNLEANNIGIKADTGEINILSSIDVKNVSSLDKKIDVKLSNPIDMIKSQVEGLKDGNTKLKFEIGSLTYDEVDKISQNIKNNSSNLIVKENLVLDSLSDINIQGSNLKANENIVLNSKVGDINILNTIDNYNEDIKEKHAKAALNLTVQNEYVETVQAVKATVESAEQLKHTKDDYSNYKSEVKKLENSLVNLKQSYKNKEIGVDYSDIEDLTDFIDNLKSQEKYYVAAIAAASADLASKTVAIATQAEAASTSGATAGFSIGVSLDVNGEKSKTNTTSQTSNASNLNAKNIYVNTDETLNTNINIIGSNLIAQNNLNINTNNLNVQSSQNTTAQTQDSKSVNGSVAFTMYGGGGGTASLGYGKSNSSSDTLINNNSQLLANNVNINASNDANFVGANVKANDTLNLNVGNNLTLESLRDEYSSNQKGFNVNVGFGLGSAGAAANRTPSLDVGKQTSSNAGMSVNNGIILNKQTVLSSITGDKVNVNVGNNTHLKGALISAGNFIEDGSFVDNKNLNFSTNTLTFENLSNTTYSSNQSLGGNFNVNQDSTKIVDQKEKTQQGGISSVGYNSENSLNVNASKTLATLGQGNITIKDKENSDDLTKLNQDTTNINKTLYSSITGSKVDATLDTRLLTEDGRKQIAEDIERTKRLTQSIGDVLSSDAFKITDTFKHIDDVQKDLDIQKALSLKNDGKTVDIIENQSNYSQTQIDKAINDYAQIYATTYGVNIDIVKMAILNKYGTTYTNEDNTSSNVYLDKILNQNALQIANTMGHEVAHVRQNQGQTYLRETTQLQEEYSNIFGNYSSSGLDFSSYVYNNVQLNSNPTSNLKLTNQDVNTLKINTNLYLQDVNKANSGDGRVDDRKLSIEEKALLFTQNANDLKEALAQNSSNLSLENINYLYELTQNAMIDEYGQKKLDEVLKKAEKQNMKDEVLFVVNEIKQQIQEDAKNNYYVDLQTGKLVPMMDVNNYEDTQYHPSSLVEQNINVFNSAVLTTTGLVPNPVVSGVAWGVDTVRNINNINDNTKIFQEVVYPGALGNPIANPLAQKTGAGLSYYNLVQSINTFNTNAKILQIQRDTTNNSDIVNIYNNLPSYESNNIKDIKIYNQDNKISIPPVWLNQDNNQLNLNLIKEGDVKYEPK